MRAVKQTPGRSGVSVDRSLSSSTVRLMIGLLGSLVGGRGGRMIGSMIGGRNGAMVGGLIGSLVGGRQVAGLGRALKGKLSGGNDGANGGDGGGGLNDDQAMILVRAMCNAAKADGHIDDAESANIMSELGDVTADERAFMQAELAAPMMSAADLAGQVPNDLKSEAYAVSLIAINVDTMQEADYLRQLSESLGMSESDRNDIHDDLGVDLL